MFSFFFVFLSLIPFVESFAENDLRAQLPIISNLNSQQSSITKRQLELDPKEAFEKLVKGNNRFAEELQKYPRQDLMIRQKLEGSQNPFAVILSCSDSRVSPEIIFDQGLGDLFIIRVAGNILGKLGLESILYGVLGLKASLVVVLGHENCGAVKAVLKDNTKLIPEIAQQLKKHCHTDNVNECIKQNVLAVVEDIKRDKKIDSLLKTSQVAVIGGYYELATGRVSFLTRP